MCVLLQVKERKLKELEKDYPTYLEQQAELEDPLRRLEVCLFYTDFVSYTKCVCVCVCVFIQLFGVCM